MSITADRETAGRRGRTRRSCTSAASGVTPPAARRSAVEDPSTGETLVEVADATADDAVAALDACVAVQDEWAEHPPRERGEILRRVFEAMAERSTSWRC